MHHVQSLRVATTGALLVAMLCVAVASAAPGDNILGGSPLATADSTLCSDGEFARGIDGTLGDIGGNDVVGAVRMACLNGASAEFLGGEPSSFRESLCDVGEVAVGIEGREGDFIDQIAARCQDDSLSGPIDSAAAFGGPGGSADGPYHCPTGQALVGLTGTVTDQSISMVRNASITCAPRADTTVTLTVTTPRRVRAKGTVEPNQSGSRVTVALFKKQAGVFERVDSDKPTLDISSEFNSSFARPNATSCKVTVRFPGDVNSNPSSERERFSC